MNKEIRTDEARVEQVEQNASLEKKPLDSSEKQNFSHKLSEERLDTESKSTKVENDVETEQKPVKDCPDADSEDMFPEGHNPKPIESDVGTEKTPLKSYPDVNSADIAPSANELKVQNPDIREIREISFEYPVVQDVLKETNMDSIRNNPEMSSFEEQLLNAADNHESGIGRERFQELIKTPTGELSTEDIKTIAEINGAVEMPKNDTLMSKVVSERVYLDYISNGQYSSTIGGCLSKAQDMQDCYTFDDYYNALGLNYPGNEFDNTDKMYVVRFTSEETESLVVRGYGGNIIDDTQKVQDALGIDSRCTFAQNSPFTGTAHTLHTENGASKMEYLPMKDDNGNRQFCKMDDGAAIYEIDRATGKERLVAIRDDEIWKKVRYD